MSFFNFFKKKKPVDETKVTNLSLEEAYKYLLKGYVVYYRDRPSELIYYEREGNNLVMKFSNVGYYTLHVFLNTIFKDYHYNAEWVAVKGYGLQDVVNNVLNSGVAEEFFISDFSSNKFYITVDKKGFMKKWSFDGEVLVFEFHDFLRKDLLVFSKKDFEGLKN